MAGIYDVKNSNSQFMKPTLPNTIIEQVERRPNYTSLARLPLVGTAGFWNTHAWSENTSFHIQSTKKRRFVQTTNIIIKL